MRRPVRHTPKTANRMVRKGDRPLVFNGTVPTDDHSNKRPQFRSAGACGLATSSISVPHRQGSGAIQTAGETHARLFLFPKTARTGRRRLCNGARIDVTRSGCRSKGREQRQTTARAGRSPVRNLRNSLQRIAIIIFSLSQSDFALRNKQVQTHFCECNLLTELNIQLLLQDSQEISRKHSMTCCAKASVAFPARLPSLRISW